MILVIAVATMTSERARAQRNCDTKPCVDIYERCLSLIKNDSDSIATGNLLEFLPAKSLATIRCKDASQMTEGRLAIEKYPTIWMANQNSEFVTFSPKTSSLRGEIKISREAWKSHCREKFGRAKRTSANDIRESSIGQMVAPTFYHPFCNMPRRTHNVFHTVLSDSEGNRKRFFNFVGRKSTGNSC